MDTTENRRPIQLLEGILLAVVFFTPLIYTSATRELFEFPKISFLYLTTLIAVAIFLWQRGGVLGAHLERTPLDKPLLLFLGTYLISTLFSLDRYTSSLGYYTRFNGGLLSVVCLITLYYLFYRQLENKKFLNAILHTLLLSASLVSLLGVAQHFGYQREQWVQDSAARVFSTLGQPNWLAAYLTMLLPLTVSLLLLTPSLWWRLYFFLVAVVLYASFWFTYSLSGWAALGTAFLVWFYLFDKKILRKKIKTLLLLLGVFFLVSFSQPGIFAPRLNSFFRQLGQAVITPGYAATVSPISYEGDTFKIRLLVWQGALAAWRQNPQTLLIGYGPETFAYAFLKFRPAALNLTSEWDFLYNKAHNDYVDILVNRGLLGLTSYLLLLITFGRWSKKAISANRSPLARSLIIALLAGWAGLLVSNFLGWSVIATSLLFWLFPTLVFRLNTLITDVKGKKEDFGAIL